MAAWSDSGAVLGAVATMVVAGATVFAAYIGGRYAHKHNEVLSERNVKENRRMIALRFLYDLTLQLHDPSLSDLFLKLKWHTFEFDLPTHVFETIPQGLKTDLNTPKEEKLIRFLDVLQMAKTLNDAGVLTNEDLSRTTIGYAIKLQKTNSVVQQYLNHIELRDKRIKYEGPAWKPLDPVTTASS